jgi:hypothetical protein
VQYYYLTQTTTFGQQGDKIRDVIYHNLPAHIKSHYRKFIGYCSGPIPVALNDDERAAQELARVNAQRHAQHGARLANPYLTELPEHNPLYTFGTLGNW